MVLGIVSYFDMGVDLFPKVDFPVISISAALPGASAEEMESSVIKPIEETLNTISGIDEMRSTTREGSVTVVNRFVLQKNGDVAAQEARDKISSVVRQLPEGIAAPSMSGSIPIDSRLTAYRSRKFGIGVVIDDAVVVQKNIFRHMEENGLDAMAAASIGTREIAMAFLKASSVDCLD